MARNKRQQDREEKRKEIIATARTLFLNEGYDATSMSRIAAMTHIAANTIYWYFKDKDELLVQVLNEEMLEKAVGYFQLKEQSIVDRLWWVIQQLTIANQLVATVHARAHVSAAIGQWHDQFHLLVEHMLQQELTQAGVSAEKIAARVKMAVFSIEGMLSHPLSDAEKQAICQELACLAREVA